MRLCLEEFSVNDQSAVDCRMHRTLVCAYCCEMLMTC